MITIQDWKDAGVTDGMIAKALWISEARELEAGALPSKAALRQRRYVERHKASLSSQNVTKASQNVTKRHESSPPSSPPNPSPKEIPPTPPKEITLTLTPSLSSSATKQTSKTRPRTRQPLAAGAQPTPNDCAAASKAGLSEEEFRQKWSHFRDHHLSKGNLMASWEAAWRTWLQPKAWEKNINPNGIASVPWQNRRDVYMPLADKFRLFDEEERRERLAKSNGNALTHQSGQENTVELLHEVRARQALG